MKKLLLNITLILTTFSLTAQESLFNGKNLDGWNIHGTELWYVENGILICESGPDKGYGYLSTEKFYDDFDLTVEFKQEANGNSGKLRLHLLEVIQEGFMNHMDVVG